MVFRSRVAFPVQHCVGRPRRAHRHAIPSPTDIILQQAGTQRGKTDAEDRGGGGRTERLFKLRRKKEEAVVKCELPNNMNQTHALLQTQQCSQLIESWEINKISDIWFT